MTTEWNDVLERLLALQALDSKIARLEQQLARAPRALKNRQTSIAGIDAKIKNVVDRTKVLRAQMQLRENELQTNEAKITRFKEQAGDVRSNKEFIAFRSEIANVQGECDRLQNEILKILDVVEQADAKVAEYETERQHEIDMATKARAVIDEKQADVRATCDGLLKQRPDRLAGIPKEALLHYEKVRKARGRGMSPIEGAYCSACGEGQTRNDVYAVQNRTRPVECAGCQRFLYQP
jgi:predicted  nucleic acid-binding Zn-ribbon protein